MKCAVSVVALALLQAGCGGLAVGPPNAAAPSYHVSSSNLAPASTHYVYWSMSEGSYAPQVQRAKVPLHPSSKVTNFYSRTGNYLYVSSGMALDPAGRLWILNYGSNDKDSPVSVFAMPFEPTSVALHHFVLSGTEGARNIAFDASGNLWVTSRTNNEVLEYKPPFTKNGSLSPAFKLTAGINLPLGLAFDAKGNLYVGNWGSFGTHSVVVFKAPIKNAHSYFLNGLYTPGGLFFDKSGNLYSSTNPPSQSAIVRYDSNDLHSEAQPTIVDAAGLLHSFGANFALSGSGDLYVSNCGVAASVFVYPTSKKPFGPRLAPTVDFKDYYLYGGCAWALIIE